MHRSPREYVIEDRTTREILGYAQNGTLCVVYQRDGVVYVDELTQQNVGNLFRQARNEKKLSLRELADVTGLHKETIWGIENKKLRNPELRTLRALVKALFS